MSTEKTDQKTSNQTLVSPARSVVALVADLTSAREIYEAGLGLKCVGETTVDGDRINDFWRTSTASFRCARFARENQPFGMVELIEPSETSGEPARDPRRPWDYGLLTLNFRTNNLEKAVAQLLRYGAERVSDTQFYNVGRPMYEVMLDLPSNQKLTILQLGEATRDEPYFNEAIATVGAIVPSMRDALEFYRDVLGLTVAITFQHAGAPFDRLLGAPEGTSLDFATLTAGPNWTGKFELLELNVPGETSESIAPRLAGAVHYGYWMTSVLTENLDLVIEKCRRTEMIEIVSEPQMVERPFDNDVRAAIVRAPGGELLEIIEQN